MVDYWVALRAACLADLWVVEWALWTVELMVGQTAVSKVMSKVGNLVDVTVCYLVDWMAVAMAVQWVFGTAEMWADQKAVSWDCKTAAKWAWC